MSATSDRERATNKQMQAQNAFQGDLRNGVYNVSNPFSNYKSPFDYSDITTNLDTIFSNQKGLIERSSADAIADSGRSMVSSLASRGITGGSAVDTAKSSAISSINRQKDEALAKLGINQAGKYADLMKYFNTQDYKNKYAGANIGLANNRNVLGGLNSSARTNASLTQNLSDQTWMDDVMAGAKLGIDVIAGVPGLSEVVEKGVTSIL